MSGLSSITIGGTEAAPAEAPKAPKSAVETATGISIDTEKFDAEQKAATEAAEAAKSERPAGLPEKFKTVEDLAKSYAELEKKLGAPKQPEAPKAGDSLSEGAPKAGDSLSLAKLVQEMATNNGQLSEASAAAMKAAGLSVADVQTYAKGVQLQAEADKAALVEIAGNDETLTAVLQWAEKNLDKDLAAAYNDAVYSGDSKLTKLIFKEMFGQFTAANGADPQLVNAPNVPNASGVTPFGSWAQVTEAMNDPRYGSDAVYRKQVEQRLAVSKI